MLHEAVVVMGGMLNQKRVRSSHHQCRMFVGEVRLKFDCAGRADRLILPLVGLYTGGIAPGQGHAICLRGGLKVL